MKTKGKGEEEDGANRQLEPKEISGSDAAFGGG